jgi:hypothetical protein
MCLAFHSPVPIEHSVFADNFDPALQLDITAGRFNHNLKFTSFDHPLVTSCFRLGRSGDNREKIEEDAIITVNSNLTYPGQKRFVIAHELGHFFLHPNARQFDAVDAAQATNWSEGQAVEEYEANLFAAELLMPYFMFAELRGLLVSIKRLTADTGVDSLTHASDSWAFLRRRSWREKAKVA